MSYARKAAQGGLWFAGFKFVTQGLSWGITIVIARLLTPADYGLMEMASILTGYVAIFSELGLGAAIIQKKEITDDELSSAFWLSMLIGGIFALSCFLLAYPTAWLFDEARVIPITQIISVLFIVGALMIVPYNLMTRDAKFKQIGMIQLMATAVASLSMAWMAYQEFGVWTLVTGTIIQRSVTVALSFWAVKWRPRLRLSMRAAGPLLRFGVNVAGSRSLFYVFQKADKFVVGKVFNAQILGYYAFAMQLASIPTEKIVSVVHQVSFPIFSHYQADQEAVRRIYLDTTKYISMMVFPLFIGGAVFAHDIVPVLLGESWLQIIPLFRIFCISQLLTSLTIINAVYHNAQGRPRWVLIYQLVNTMVMPLSIYLAATYSFSAVLVPWVTLYPVLCMRWTWSTLRAIGISNREYFKVMGNSCLATAIMVAGIILIQFLMETVLLIPPSLKMMLLQELGVGGMLYCAYLILFEKNLLIKIWSLRKV